VGHFTPVTELLYLLFAELYAQYLIWLFAAVLDFVLSAYVAQVYPELLNIVPLAPVIIGITLFCTPQALYFCCKR
jgi:hypothetical protein